MNTSAKRIMNRYLGTRYLEFSMGVVLLFMVYAFYSFMILGLHGVSKRFMHTYIEGADYSTVKSNFSGCSSTFLVAVRNVSKSPRLVFKISYNSLGVISA